MVVQFLFEYMTTKGNCSSVLAMSKTKSDLSNKILNAMKSSCSCRSVITKASVEVLKYQSVDILKSCIPESNGKTAMRLKISCIANCDYSG